jgi:hypothetical protein
MFRKLLTLLPIAILLGAVSAAPALAQTRNHHLVPPHKRVTVFPNVGAAYAFAPSATSNFLICPPMEGPRLSPEWPYAVYHLFNQLAASHYRSFATGCPSAHPSWPMRTHCRARCVGGLRPFYASEVTAERRL